MHDDCLSRKNIWKETTKYKPREQYRAAFLGLNYTCV